MDELCKAYTLLAWIICVDTGTTVNLVVLFLLLLCWVCVLHEVFVLFLVLSDSAYLNCTVTFVSELACCVCYIA